MSILRRAILASLVRACLGPATLALALMLALPLAAQTLTNSFGGLSKSSKDPIDIESDVLVVHDQQKYATFKGNVKAVQGTTTLRAKELNVHYTGGGDKFVTGEGDKAGGDQAATETKVADAKGASAATGTGDGNGTQITKIEAKGDVVITSENDQTTSSEWAIYDVPSQQVTVGGNVVLTQGKNVLKGDRLVIDLTTGESRFDNTGNNAVAGGRIRALFMPKEGADTAKSGEAKPGEAAPQGAPAPAAGDEASETANPAADDQGEAASASTSSTGTGGAAPKDSTPAMPADDSPWPLVPGLQQ
jgi:lipopolysaccharide export system protein LptA